MIEILTSGVALGVHVPGLLLADRLRERGVQARVRVLERLLPEDKLAVTNDMKWAFHRDFRFALVGQAVAGAPAFAVTDQMVDDLIRQWRAAGVRRFVVFSGFWLTLLERYAATCDAVPSVDICHVDSVASPSFRDTGATVPWARHVWLADAERVSLPWTIPVSAEPVVAWGDRERRLLVHGGGWGMGTYREKADELRGRGFDLDVVAYEQRDVSVDDPGVRFHMVDPEWHPWLDDGYPPFGAVHGDERPVFHRGNGHHGSFDVMRLSAATVSKPGGGTLLDSLWSGTPVVLLEPFGGHEQRNSELWQELGFGISFERWSEAGFDMGLLEESHRALVKAAADIPDYSGALTKAGE